MKRANNIFQTVIGWTIGELLEGWILHWCNYVIFSPQYSYWQWVFVSISVSLCTNVFAPLKYAIRMAICACVIAQFCAWANVFSLPLFHR